MFQGRIESEIPDINDRPQVLYCKEKGNQIKIYINSGGSEVLEMTLCSNVGYELPEELKVTHPTVDIEWLLELDPEVIIIGAAAVPYKCGYPVDDYSEIATAREGIMNNPVWARNTAVKEGKVYVTASGSLTYSPSYIVGASYYVKWIYPDLFEDFDPVAIHQEYVDFQGIDFDVREHGVFVYPPM
jgi:iron complex transport system substrate-binding protein